MSDATPTGDVVDRRAARRRTIGFTVGALLLVAFFVGIWLNTHYTPPDSSDPAVVADTARAVQVIERSFAQSTDGATTAACAARLLDRDGAALLVHASCVARPGPTRWDGPYRIEADGSISTPALGADFTSEVKRLFGAGLGDWYLNHQGGFTDTRPPAAPGTATSSPIPSQ